MGIHFAIGQIIAYLGLYLLVNVTGQGWNAYYSQVVTMTGLTGILAMIPGWFFYRRDRWRRNMGGLIPSDAGGKLMPAEALLLFLTGCGLAEYVNLLVNLLFSGLQSEFYQDSMERITSGKSLGTLILWMGIIAPLAEEVIFRWLIYLRLRDHLRVAAAAVLSALIFGVYHGNLLQGIYAAVMGVLFALLLEWSGSLWGSALLHIGANTWSLIMNDQAEFFMEDTGLWIFMGISMVLFMSIVGGFFCFHRKYEGRGRSRQV